MHICGVENLSGNCEQAKKDNRQNNNEISKNLCKFCTAGTNIHFSFSLNKIVKNKTDSRL